MDDTYQVQQAPTPSPQIGFPSQPPAKQSSNAVKIIILVVGLLLIVGAGGYFLLKGDSGAEDDLLANPTPDSSLSQLETPASEPTASATPTATPKAVSKSDISISVLNGTGIPGEASLLKKELEKLGYSKIEAGNATSQNETRTTVTYSSTVSDTVSSEITKMLETMYAEVRTKKGAVAGGDIEVLTGPRKGSKATASPKASGTPAPSKSPSPSPTPTPTSTN